MKTTFEVIYFSRGGNTKKIAEAMAEELGVNAEDVRNKDKPSKDSVLFIGSGLYGGRIANEISEFISKNDFRGRSTYVFGTSGSGDEQVVKKITGKVREKGGKVEGSFSCKGAFFLIFNRGHPSGEEMTRARVFARNARENLS